MARAALMGCVDMDFGVLVMIGFLNYPIFLCLFVHVNTILVTVMSPDPSLKKQFCNLENSNGIRILWHVHTLSWILKAADYLCSRSRSHSRSYKSRV